MLDRGAVVKLAEQYANAVAQELSPDAVVLFGSCWNGTPHEDSDIDVAVYMNDFTGDWLKTSSRLWGFIQNVSYNIEPHLMDLAHDRSGFARHVLRTGKVVYQAPKHEQTP